MRKISILGIVLGGIVALFAGGILAMGLGVYAAMHVDVVHQSSPAKAQEMVRAFAYDDPVMYYGGMTITFACCILGGWLSAFTARAAERVNGLLVFLIPGGMHFAKFGHRGDQHALVVQLLYVSVFALGGWLGGSLRAAQVKKRIALELRPY